MPIIFDQTCIELLLPDEQCAGHGPSFEPRTLHACTVYCTTQIFKREYDNLTLQSVYFVCLASSQRGCNGFHV